MLIAIKRPKQIVRRTNYRLKNFSAAAGKES